MKNKYIKIFILGIFVVFLVGLPISINKKKIVQENLAYSASNFASGWLNNVVTGSAGYSEGQKRGYFTGGSFSGRFNLKNDYLFDMSPPHLRFGCGGIDAYLGGFGFLKPEYLVKKLQAILQAAPAMAFQIALTALCKDCTNIMNALENMASKLNDLQLNDCKASKVVASTALDALNGLGNADLKSEAEKNSLLSSGQSGLATEITDKWRGITAAGGGLLNSIANIGGGGTTTSPSTTNQGILNDSDKIAGCTPGIKSMFFNSDFNSGPGTNNGNSSVLANFVKFGVYDETTVAMIRGLIGDIQIHWGTHNDSSGNRVDDVTHSEIQPCPDNKGIQSFVDGDVYLRYMVTTPTSPNGGNADSCKSAGDANVQAYFNVRAFVTNKINSIYGNMLNNRAFTTDDEAFIAAMPFSLLPVIRLAIKMEGANGQDGDIMRSLINVAANAYAYAMLSDFTAKGYEMIGALREVITKYKNLQSQVPGAQCDMELVGPVYDSVNTITIRLNELSKKAITEYTAKSSEINQINTLMNNYKKFEALLHNNLAGTLNTGVFNRIMQ